MNSDFEKLLLNWLDPTTIIPAMTLLAFLLLMVFIMLRAQKRDDFDFGEALREEKPDGTPGKLSNGRLLQLGAFAVSAWALMVYAVAHAIPEWMWWGFLAAWSLSKAIELLVQWMKTKGQS